MSVSTIRRPLALFSALARCVTFHARADEPERFVMVQLCDTQLGQGGYEHDLETFRLAVGQINALNPDFVVLCGDLVDNGADPKAYEDFLSVYKGFEVPCHLAPGNHDVGRHPSIGTLERYRRVIGPDYFSFEHEGYTIVIVNTQLWKRYVKEESEKHDAWFEETLRNAHENGRPVIVAGHFPPFLRDVNEKENGLNLPLEKRIEIMEMCERYGVVLFLAGHIHRNNVTEYKGIPVVATATTSMNVGSAPLGYRVWNIGPPNPGTLTHEYVAVDGAVRPQDLRRKSR